MNVFVLAQEPYPATDFSGTWTVFGLMLVAVVALWFFVVFFTTRAPKPVPVYTPPPVPRLDHLGEIAMIEARMNAGELDSRETHTELSSVVRRFVSERTGIAADRMHIGELQRSGLPMVPDLIAVFYPVQFARESGGDSAQAVAMARSVIQNWPVQ